MDDRWDLRSTPDGPLRELVDVVYLAAPSDEFFRWYEEVMAALRAPIRGRDEAAALVAAYDLGRPDARDFIRLANEYDVGICLDSFGHDGEGARNTVFEHGEAIMDVEALIAHKLVILGFGDLAGAMLRRTVEELEGPWVDLGNEWVDPPHMYPASEVAQVSDFRRRVRLLNCIGKSARSADFVEAFWATASDDANGMAEAFDADVHTLLPYVVAGDLWARMMPEDAEPLEVWRREMIQQFRDVYGASKSPPDYQPPFQVTRFTLPQSDNAKDACCSSDRLSVDRRRCLARY